MLKILQQMIICINMEEVFGLYGEDRVVLEELALEVL
jgi:hypothetical protein